MHIRFISEATIYQSHTSEFDGGVYMEDMLYTVPEVAKILKTNVDYVYKLQKAGIIKFIKVGRLKCRRATLEKFLETYDGFDVSDPFSIQILDE